MFRFANYVFGTEVEPNSDNENQYIEHIERDIDGDWILIDVSFPHNYEKQTIGSDGQNPNDLQSIQSIAANYETTTDRVPHSLDTTSDAQYKHSIDKSCHSGDDNVDSASPSAHAELEESWFVTPPPCFNSLSNPIIIDTPFENLLIEHPSISVFGPSLPPIDHHLPHSDSSSTDMSSNDSTVVVTQTQSRRQLRQIRRQQQNSSVQNRNGNQNSINLHLRTVVLDELHVLAEMQSREVSQLKKLLTRSQMDRQNKVLVQRNKPQTRRSKMADRPNGIYNNRKNC